MVRLALGVEYVGKNYSGWQHQLQAAQSVQDKLEQALSGIAAQPVATICAGRTDAGVHASGQVVHCDVTVQRSEREWIFGSNRLLPDDIRVLWAKTVDTDFHARRSAIARRYKYVIYNNPIRPSLLRDYVCWHYYPLDIEAMRVAAQYWVGEHDFTSFRAAGCQSKSAIRHVREINIKRHGEMIVIDVVGNAFLYHMVRNMVGVLLRIGAGKQPSIWAQQVLQARDRKAAAVTAPAGGLYLVGVDYPIGMQVPQATGELWFLNQDKTI